MHISIHCSSHFCNCRDSICRLPLLLFADSGLVHFTVIGGNEAEVDLVLIQPFLRYYVNRETHWLCGIMSQGTRQAYRDIRSKVAINGTMFGEMTVSLYGFFVQCFIDE